jgi:hypothetical protein
MDIPNAGAGTRSSQVQSEVEFCRKLTDDLGVLLSSLEARLSSSLRPPQPNKPTDGGDRALLVPLAEAIYDINADMRFRLTQLSDIIDRIEI